MKYITTNDVKYSCKLLDLKFPAYTNVGIFASRFLCQ